ncbi:ImmA/IrrE family metallo-endopeptidase [Sediminicoccus rosea]|uniref:ImmA/IrrE family metallo-endopeptidase n=1 Tax=Sediminicoccus rosea TaxID=1225128 RepID=A0ABZ0PMQ7_9PROT|nr:ImmA/IrrE family metallo-endopeptidase [Sediminicoccus rosea]WPB86927.1 ImmA/IrrE family metallo-endopeptidase [Sediminicoccus rosea]
MEVIRDFADRAPVDLDAMARALGVEVRRDQNLPENVSGKIERRRAGVVATINASHLANRQRFTLAHELAHRILHSDLIGDGITDDGLYRSSLSDDIERQANAFAAELLMPARLVRKLYREGMKDTPSIAERFDVSYDAARVRLRELFG